MALVWAGLDWPSRSVTTLIGIRFLCSQVGMSVAELVKGESWDVGSFTICLKAHQDATTPCDSIVDSSLPMSEQKLLATSSAPTNAMSTRCSLRVPAILRHQAVG